MFDTYSKWIEAIPLKQTNSQVVIETLRNIFVTFGIPNQIVSDNGPPFNSKEFEVFCRSNGIEVLKSPVYHPQSNGSAERAVQTLKQGMKKSLIDPKKKSEPFNLKLNRFLFSYRTTPTSVTNLSPSRMIFNFKPRTLIDLLKQSIQGKTKEKISKIKSEEKWSKNKFRENQEILYSDPFCKEAKWVKGKIIKRVSNCRFLILVNGRQKQAHIDQIKEIYYGKTFVFRRSEDLRVQAEEKQLGDNGEPRVGVTTRSMTKQTVDNQKDVFN